MPLRSLLFVPGDSEAKLAGATRHGADALILDLEDSVAPARKSVARGLVADYLRDPARDRGARCLVRINAIQTGLAWDDLAAVLAARPDGLMLPKGDPLLLGELEQRLRELEQRLGLEVGALPVWVLATETARGLFTVGQFAGVSARLRGLSWGNEDLAAELGAVNRGADGQYTGYLPAGAFAVRAGRRGGRRGCHRRRLHGLTATWTASRANARRGGATASSVNWPSIPRRCR